MECIKEYLNKYPNKDVEQIIYKLLKDKSKTKNLRDKIIVESFDSMYDSYEYNKDIIKVLSIKFGISQSHIKYIITNRCLLG